VASRISITRVTRLTELDCVGIPVVAAIRDNTVGESVTVCTGKGISTEVAELGSLAESLERYCAEPRERVPVHVSTVAQLEGCKVDPRELIVADWAPAFAELEWVGGFSVLSGAEVWVPANAVFFPYHPRNGRLLFAPNTTGLAVGSTLGDAMVRGLLECIERDAYSRAMALACMGHGAMFPLIAPVALGAEWDSWAKKLAHEGVNVMLREITGDLGIPTVLATIYEPGPRGPVRCHAGIAADFTLMEAAERAIAEAAQSRLTDIQGSREDLPEHSRRETAAAWFYEPSGEEVKTSMPPVPAEGRISRGDVLTGALAAVGLPEPVYVDLSLSETFLRTVRVVCPGLEMWAVDPSRRGIRVRKWLCEQ
jgi:ribosomal protein S12 methylthiotransferase accessory factor